MERERRGKNGVRNKELSNGQNCRDTIWSFFFGLFQQKNWGFYSHLSLAIFYHTPLQFLRRSHSNIFKGPLCFYTADFSLLSLVCTIETLEWFFLSIGWTVRSEKKLRERTKNVFVKIQSRHFFFYSECVNVFIPFVESGSW